MRQPLAVTLQMTGYVIGNKLRHQKRFPMVLMLEPTLKCNLTCTGCGKVRQDAEIMGRMLTVEECLAAVDEAGAPAVSIAGGEPLIHPDFERIVEGVLQRKKLTMLCTNGILIERALKKLRPDPFLTIVFHLDGLSDRHDVLVERKGVFDICIEGIKRCKEHGFRVATNTTLYKGTDPGEIAQLFRMLMDIGVDGVIVSPGFSYEEVGSGADFFLKRQEAIALFREIHSKAGDVRYWNTPPFIDFLRGERNYTCTPWGNPCRDPLGWKGPCYLLTDGRYETFAELMERTPWDEYGYGVNPRCEKCMAHCGYEPTAVTQMGPREMFQMLRWNLSR
ncbi:MAG: adenosyl-hopene transferase HpnH [Chloroflexi bacterium]|nr:adenosyl-hopene transferase HpnH [Chloroflexota bacterium]